MQQKNIRIAAIHNWERSNKCLGMRRSNQKSRIQPLIFGNAARNNQECSNKNRKKSRNY